MLFDNNLVYYQSPCESFLNVAAFLAPPPPPGGFPFALWARAPQRWWPRVGSLGIILYYTIYYRCRCSYYKYISGAEGVYIFVMVPKWNLAVNVNLNWNGS